MSTVRDDLGAIRDRLTTTLHEIEQRLSAPAAMARTVGTVDPRQVSDAAMAADRLRFIAHFQGRTPSGAPNAARSRRSPLSSNP